MHPLQRAFMDHHGLQCGFCTPGFLMLAVGVLEREPDISDDDLLDVLSSNLCRCTGYQNIVKAVRAAAAEMRGDVMGRVPNPLGHPPRRARHEGHPECGGTPSPHRGEGWGEGGAALRAEDGVLTRPLRGRPLPIGER